MMYQTVKRRLHAILETTSPDDIASRVFAIFMILFILLNVVSVTLETVESLSTRYGALFVAFDVFSIAVFTVEYALRLWTCTLDKRYEHPIWGRLRYATSPLAMIDLLAIVPFYLPFILPDMRFVRILRLLRFLRVLKLGRYSDSVKTLGSVLKSKVDDLAVVLVSVSILLVFASSLVYFAEHDAQPKVFSDIPAAMWWGVVTLTTVGYGDIYPVTPIGKMLGAGIALMGVGLFTLPAGILASGFAEEMNRKRRRKTLCPHCGRDINEPADTQSA
jgi:voltage-gated potassium channel